jgi:hypothetical protein
MSNRPTMSGIFRLFFGLAIAFTIVLGATAVHAQCPSKQDEEPDTGPFPAPTFPDPKKPPQLEELILPEAGFLSETHYTSQFFGFSMDLPLTVQGHEIMMSVMPEREHALLSLQFEKGQQNGYITITALDPKPGMEVKTPEQQEQQQQLRNWAQNGGPLGLPPQFPIPDYMLRTGHWYYSLRHKGSIFAAQYWTNINNYVVKVVIGTNDKNFLTQAKKSMSGVTFYCPQDDGTLEGKDGKPVTVEGKPYQGPTVPTFRVNKALKEQPSQTIALGGVSGGVYRNPDIGLQYTVPEGWTVLPNRNGPLPEDAPREDQFLRACSQTLLRVAPPPASDKGFRDGPMIVLRALDYNCLSMRTAVSLTDKRGLDETAASMEEMGQFGKIDTDQLKTISDHLFMVFHGTYSVDPRSEDLSQRMSQTIYATVYNKLLLVWSLLAPSSTELEHLPTGGIVLEGLAPIQLQQSLRAKY